MSNYRICHLHNKYIFICNNCNKSFSLSVAVKKHISSLNGCKFYLKKTNLFKCNSCNYNFASKHYLNLHNKKYNGNCISNKNLKILNHPYKSLESELLFKYKNLSDFLNYKSLYHQKMILLKSNHKLIKSLNYNNKLLEKSNQKLIKSNSSLKKQLSSLDSKNRLLLSIINDLSINNTITDKHMKILNSNNK